MTIFGPKQKFEVDLSERTLTRRRSYTLCTPISTVERMRHTDVGLDPCSDSLPGSAGEPLAKRRLTRPLIPAPMWHTFVTSSGV